jgi:O-antigen/teichoic acid export membrane protein
MITPLFSFLGIILLPYISQAITRHEMEAADRLITRLSLLYSLAAIVFIAILWLFTEFLTTLLFASSYVVTIHLTRIMIIAILPQAAYMLFRNTIDAVSVIPYNALILGICLLCMIISFMLSTTPVQFAWAYVAVSILQGFLSWITWTIIRKK